MLLFCAPDQLSCRCVGAQRYVYLLFFDGGSRGNPGPGGAGSVIVWHNTDIPAAELRWAASISYGSTTTMNNTAEYRDLVHGLRCATSEGYTPLHVIEDSAMFHDRPTATAPSSARKHRSSNAL